MELEHGWHRANTAEAALKRRRYLDEVLAGKIDDDMRKACLVIATVDLLIGVTALHYGYAIGTRNIRHFRMIPGLTVLAL